MANNKTFSLDDETADYITRRRGLNWSLFIRLVVARLKTEEQSKKGTLYDIAQQSKYVKTKRTK